MLKDTLFVSSLIGDGIKYVIDTESPVPDVVYGKASLILKHEALDNQIRVLEVKKILSWRRDPCGAVELFWGDGGRYDQHHPLRLESPLEAAELVNLIDAIYTASAQYGPLESDTPAVEDDPQVPEPKDPWRSEVPWAHKDWTPDDDIEEQEEYGTDEEAEYGTAEDYDEDYDDEEDDDDEDY